MKPPLTISSAAILILLDYMDIGYHVGERNEDEYFESDDESPLYRGIALQETRETASVEEDDTDGIVEDDQSL